MSYNSGSNRARNFKSASRFALVRFWKISPDYSLNCTPLGPITVTYPLTLFLNHSRSRKYSQSQEIANLIKFDTVFFWTKPSIFKWHFANFPWSYCCENYTNFWKVVEVWLNPFLRWAIFSWKRYMYKELILFEVEFL